MHYVALMALVERTHDLVKDLPC